MASASSAPAAPATVTYYADLPPLTKLDALGLITHPLGHRGSHNARLPPGVDPRFVVPAAAIQGPAVVSHDLSWRQAARPEAVAVLRTTPLTDIVAAARAEADLDERTVAAAEEEARRLAKAGFGDSLRRKEKEEIMRKAALKTARDPATLAALAPVDRTYATEDERTRAEASVDATQDRLQSLEFDFNFS